MARVSDTTNARQDTNRAHRSTVELSIREVVRLLTEGLGVNLTAYIADRRAQTVRRWVEGSQHPDLDIERTLRNTLQVFRLVEQADGTKHVARSWFIGMNPQLDDHSPSEMLLQGNAREVLAAARAYVAGG